MIADHRTGTSDSTLVLQCQQGDGKAFQQLYRRYQPRVSSTLYQLCGSEMLDDLLQEVFCRVWRGLPKLRQPSYFSTWLYRICWNVATDGRRQFAKRQLETSFPSTEPEDTLAVEENLSRPQDTPDLLQLHYQDLVQRGLKTLSLEHRVVLVLHDLEDLPQKEISKILQIPTGTVKSRLYYARNAIRQYLQQQGVVL
ncbi:RNA polymerase subunit sigma [Aphanothece hegewaldii CCALA 016]|uniref:RNA polymerase subunit sigma n=1 Tax=Aphanothece hegewaldii CCALA 016 TaxID=2107694 RepID=A0A2T1LUM8_9CHRO|nr:sigma-70 family RNA polymerase sigma factor [Aphanothece hegewaldii]PSF35269.1 RNA polymerase subunit sigma [Aphanothece hegewaldii CCALA 016]